jgi:hypothetical protein
MQCDNDLPISVQAKVLPLRPDINSFDLARQTYFTAVERGRHYLKIVLPGIPITIFTSSFLFSYFIEASNASRSNRQIDPTGPFVLSMALTFITCALCAAIYNGFRQVTGLDEK